MRIIAIGVIFVLGVTAVACAEVALTVRDHAGCPRASEPVRGGVPFARGELAQCDSARLVDARGNDLPCAVRPIARWWDGSIKWLLVDTQLSLPAGGVAHLRLLPGEQPPRPPALAVSDTDRAITVDTGAVRFVFSKARFGLPAAAWGDLDGDGTAETQVVDAPGEFVCEVEHEPPGQPNEEEWLRDAAGGARERFVAAPEGDYRAEVESTNHLRAVVKLSGWLVNTEGRRLLQYVIRAHACAGSPDLRLAVTFVYAGDPKRDFIRALSLSFPWAEQGRRWALGGESAHEGELSAGESVSLWEIGPQKIYHLAPYDQDKTVYYQLARGDEQIATGAEAAGWARLAGDDAAFSLALRDFWPMHPKELQVGPAGMTVYLWPERGGKVLDLRRRYDYVENTYHYDLSMWPYGGEGVAVTHEVALRFGPADQTPEAQMVAALNAPLLLQCEPAYYASTLACGPFAPADPAGYPHLEGVQAVELEWIRHNQRAFHWDGMIDFGDTLFHGYATPSHYGYVAEKGWCSRGYVGWLNNDGTLVDSLFLQFLRTGDYEAFRTAEAMCRHVMDVDTCHWCAAEPDQVGGGHRHDQQHWGNGVRGYGTATHGVIDYYCLTGNERALDVALEYARYHDTGTLSENEDRIGGLIRVWEITGDEHWKRRADELLAQELAVASDSPWRFVTQPHFRFVSNTTKSLLHYLYAAPPQDITPLLDAITRSLDGLAPRIMVAWEDPGGYPTYILAALAYQQTGERRYVDLLVALLKREQSALPLAEQVPPDLVDQMRALDFPGMLAVAQAWRVNNVYSAGIMHLAPYPYAIAALQAAGIDEAALWVTELSTAGPEPFEEVLDPARISVQYPNGFRGGPAYSYTYALEHGSPSDKGGTRSELMLLEDGVPLTGHQAHLKIIQEGGGLFSHWGARGLIFSTSDNTDPRTNGREYRVVYPWPQQ
ncbi:MAG: hypothetical protein AB7Y46_17180 [Armatimonadota bacterium]